MVNYWKLIASIVVCQVAGFIGSLFTAPTWYDALSKPFFTPPSWIFAPAWITLYLLMGISLYIIWTNKTKGRYYRNAIWIFWIQFVLNAMWSVIFFGLQAPFWALIEILLMWGAIVLMIVYFYKISKTASYLLVPYILWVTFALMLNLAIYILN